MKKLSMSASVLLISLLAACASDKPAEVAAPTTPTEAPAPVAETPKEVAPVAVDPLNDPNNILSKRETFFDFDKSVVKAEYKPMLQAHGQFLGANADRRVEVEGNCDERGSSEYNLALGNRRANAVKKMLEVSGAKAAQIATVSFGEEKPRDTAHNEAAWSQNRRADIVYK
jgi:peptidoglycan-associated lipoprotein